MSIELPRIHLKWQINQQDSNKTKINQKQSRFKTQNPKGHKTIKLMFKNSTKMANKPPRFKQDHTYQTNQQQSRFKIQNPEPKTEYQQTEVEEFTQNGNNRGRG